MLRGTVGAGKTTYCQRLKDQVERSGGVCLVQGTDAYQQRGLTVQQAIPQIQAEIRNFISGPNPNKVLVIDTCGEKTNKNNVFGLNLSSWQLLTVFPNLQKKKKQLEYLAWSLRNVLRRGPMTPDSGFFLTPHTAGWQTCIDVHRKKATSLFGPKQKMLDDLLAGASSKEMVIERLNPLADAYQMFLDTDYIERMPELGGQTAP